MRASFLHSSAELFSLQLFLYAYILKLAYNAMDFTVTFLYIYIKVFCVLFLFTHKCLLLATPLLISFLLNRTLHSVFTTQIFRFHIYVFINLSNMYRKENTILVFLSLAYFSYCHDLSHPFSCKCYKFILLCI